MTQEHHVAPTLQPLYRRLSSAEHSLQEWHDTGHCPTKQELTHVQSDIARIDKHYQQGMFMLNGDIPEGQAIMANKLNHAHALLREFEIAIQ
jgi:hypothetical protein